MTTFPLVLGNWFGLGLGACELKFGFGACGFKFGFGACGFKFGVAGLAAFGFVVFSFIVV